MIVQTCSKCGHKMYYSRIFGRFKCKYCGHIFKVKLERVNNNMIRQDRELIKHAKNHFGMRKITALEVGVFHGGNAVSILKNLNVGRLYLVDPYKECMGYSKDREELFYKDTKMRMAKYGNKVMLIRKRSSDVVINDTFDFIYLDGNYAEIKNDFKKFFPLLNKDGIIGGYAFSGNHRQFVEDVLDIIDEYKLGCCFGGDLNEWWII